MNFSMCFENSDYDTFILLNWIHSYRTGFLDAFFRITTHAGSLYVILPVTAVLVLILLNSGKYRETKILLSSIFLSVLVSHGIKLIFRRPRPDINPPLISMPMDWSFPSAHTAQISALCLFISFYALRHFQGPWPWLVYILSFILIAVVGYSRMYLQVHHPTDVLAGFLLAALIVIMSNMNIKT